MSEIAFNKKMMLAVGVNNAPEAQKVAQEHQSWCAVKGCSRNVAGMTILSMTIPSDLGGRSGEWEDGGSLPMCNEHMMAFWQAYCA